MPRARKGQQKVTVLKKTTGLCPSRSYYSMGRGERGDGRNKKIGERETGKIKGKSVLQIWIKNNIEVDNEMVS